MSILPAQFGSSDVADQPPLPVNPATLLPMQNSSIDVQGNPFGVDLHGGFPPINSCTGFPMMGSTGIDVVGNPFGHNFNDPFGS